jgi:hypothetical protein
MEILIIPFKLFVLFPPLAILPAVCFFFLYKKFDLKRHLGMSLLWLTYTLYESAMWYWAKGVVAPIRVDLILIAPAMILSTAVVFYKRKSSESSSS